MKRGTSRHPKVQDLIKELGERRYPLPYAIGMLELLWHFTAEFAPQGDIGKYTDDRIEAAIGWTGGRGRAVRSLTNSRWCDASEQHRVIVHDWHDHADDNTRKRLARANLSFLSFTPKVTGKCPEPSPNVSACLSQSQSQSQSLAASAADPPAALPLAEWCATLYARHPKKRDRILVEGAMVRIMAAAADPVALFAEIDASHALWCATESWQEKNSQFCPKLAAWLEDAGWTQRPRQHSRALAVESRRNETPRPPTKQEIEAMLADDDPRLREIGAALQKQAAAS